MAGTRVEERDWGMTPDGAGVKLFTLKNDAVTVKLCTYGARITSLCTRDRDGGVADIVLGSDDPGMYVNDRKTYMGAVVGRFANRIAGGRFVLDGIGYEVPKNNGANSLHGGPVGFDQRVWDAEMVEDGVRFTYVSPDGEMGFPGELTVRVTYTLSGNALRIEYEGDADRPTVASLSNHAYFNLTGRACEVGGHRLTLHAGSYTPVDATLIPTGEVRAVEGTPMDFRVSKAMGRDWDSADEQVQFACGFDQNWVIAGEGLRLAAEVEEPESGRGLKVFTTEPGLQFYSGNFLDGSFVGRSGACERRYGFCLETQRYPDTPNQADFPSAGVDRDSPYRSTTILVFN